ncbi:hypothetical protein SLEP1_g4309 [Rubroshorea leprosula]|uniref:Uncharacterized protein n=1 Tax=Rubroshorea leprosula TaxID=152421 RepID=A0AAV5HNS4_9ROSI|nr:hypothetical protein SLEP1_g4309 [Rubroshorea leprosula]
MAVEVCSPRISFSHDLNKTEETHHQQRLDSSLLDSASDFNFCIADGFAQELSSADELFLNGKILPIQIKKPSPTTKKTHHSNPVITPSPPLKIIRQDSTEKKRLKEFLSMSLDADDKPPPPSISFWQFKRSSSLNCDSSRSKGLIRSLLSRSNSTGSAPNPKRTTILKETQKQTLQKQPSLSRKSSVSSSSSYYVYSSSTQKPPSKYGNGVRVSPVLNLPHPFISNANVSFFGFGSIFCSGKVKKKKR